MEDKPNIAKGALVLAVILAFWIGCDFNRLSDLSDNPSVDEIESNLNARIRIDAKPYLRNPRSASFSGASWAYFQLEKNVYSIRGSVRGENGLGGLVQTPIYAVYLFAESADELLLEALRLGDEWVVDGYYTPFGKIRPE